MNRDFLKHTGSLMKFILRRDRLRVATWILSIAFVVILVPLEYVSLYPTAADRATIAVALENPAMVAMVGPGYGLDNVSYGALTGAEMILFAAIAAAIMNIFLVIRHTRKEEEGGRIEVIRSLPVGRLSNLFSTLLSSVVVNVLLASITGGMLYATGVESITLHGSLLFGAAIGAAGLFFAGVAAILCQLSDSALGATGGSIALLGAAYFIRAIGDVGNETLSLFSPLGWITRTETYVSNRWWPVLLCLVFFVVFSIISLVLNSVRDMGAGFFRQRPGRSKASVLLRSPTGLSLRLVRTSMISWIIGMVILGASYGSVMGDVDTFLSGNEMMQKFMAASSGATIVEQYITLLMTIMSIFCTVPGIILMLRLRTEEKRGRTEHLLARAVSRERLFSSYLFPSLIVTALVQVLSILGLWAAGYAVMDAPPSLENLLKAGMIYLPAMWVMIALTAFLVAFLPRFTSFIWVYLIASFFIVYMGGLLQLPDWTARLFPYGNIPRLPLPSGEEINYYTLAALVLITLDLIFAGYYAFGRRDIVPE
jgi:ABC-2 type transport system permease protein